MFIYKITNTVNNKCYIGQTIRPVDERFKRHINDALNCNLDTHFARAIRKYGSDAFVVEQIDEANTQEELNKKEQEYIRKYQTTTLGYNETDALYKCGGNTYQSKTVIEMREISDKIRKSKIGALNPNHKSIKVRNEETNEEYFFDTVNECRIFFNEKNHRFITNRVTCVTKSLYKGIWNIAYADEDYKQLTKDIIRHDCNIVVEDKKTNTIKKFFSIRKMVDDLKINRSKIKKGVNVEIGDYKINFE